MPQNAAGRILIPTLLLSGCQLGAAAVPGNPVRQRLPPLSDGLLVITGANVLSMADSVPLHDQTIVIRDGLIVSMTRGSRPDHAEGATVLDAAGQWVLPGLADMHVHLREEDLLAYRRAGITTVRNMWGTEQVAARQAELAAGADHPAIFSASPGLDGDPPVWPGSAVVTDAPTARAEVHGQVAAGWDFIKVYNRLTPGVYAAILDEARLAGIRVVGHIPVAVDVRTGVAGGQASIEHLTGIAEDVAGSRAPAGWLRLDRERAARLASELASRDIWICPTAVVLELLASQRLPAAESRIARRNQMAMVRILHEAGAPLLAGTDAGLGLVPAGESLARELEIFVEAGLSPYESLRTATVEPARFLGVEEQLGTIEVGKRADLIILPANPLADIRNMRSPVAVLQRGKRVL